jgi:release factor glutamine methyltransferase
VTADVLSPRPDTETLVAAALEQLPERDTDARILEIGTGSGAVALALAHERPRARITATDVSPAALKVAERNARELGLEGRIEFAEGSLFGPVVGRRFELVVSNPPYLAESERSQLAPELAHEPEVALFAGPDGLAVLRELVAGATAFLAPGGGFAVELAPDQAPTVAHWLREAGLGDVITHRDLAARPRVVSARGPHPPESENI